MELERTVQQWSFGGARIRWGAIFAGFVVGVAVQMMLTLLGLAIGAWSVDVQDTDAARSIPIGTAVWSGISMLVAAFIGGYVAARMAGATDRGDGLYHGAVVWGFNWLVFAWLATTAMSFMIGGVFNVFGSAIQSLSQGVGSTVARLAQSTNVNLSMEDVRRQVESVLQATGKKELQPGQIREEAGQITNQAQSGKPIGEVSDSALREIREKLAALDRDAAINVMVNKLGMSRAQAEEVVHSTIGLIGPIQRTVENVKEQSVSMANTAVDRIGSAAWWLFLLALLTLGAAAGGGAFGVVEEPGLEMQSQAVRDVRRTAS
ncbi:hypothetical protein [Candidatus Nitrospira bockiana]